MSDQLPAVIVLERTAVATTGAAVPAAIAAAGEQASWRYLEFFTANIRNPHTRRAYGPQMKIIDALSAELLQTIVSMRRMPFRGWAVVVAVRSR